MVGRTSMQQSLKKGLFSGEIHWWFSFLGEPISDVGTGVDQDVLSTNELARRQSFRFERDRNLYTEAHLLLRFALSQYSEVHPARLRFKKGDFGRPELDCPTCGPRLRFSLSHTRNLATCAIVLEDDIGVDAEKDVGRLLPEISEWFASAEQADLASLPIQAQATRFFEYWTLKESYLKARGLGLQVPLDSFWFLKAEDRWRLHCSSDIENSPDSWRFEVLAPTSTHLAALAVRSEQHARRRIRLVGFDRETGPFLCTPVGSDLDRRASFTSSPPYFAFQW
jgi:4'-phosphopantetheinyl transferase